MPSFVERIVGTLIEAKVEFVVVGGVSAVLQGAPIVTQDLDLCYRRTRENLARLAAALKPLKPALRGLPPGVPNVFDERSLQLGSNFTLEIEGESLDLLGQMSGLGGYDDIVARSEEMDLAQHRVNVLALRDLITTKRAAGRPKDLAAIPMLEATLKMKEQSANDERG